MRRRNLTRWIVAAAMLALAGSAKATQAAVIVLANRTEADVTCTLAPEGAAAYIIKLSAGEVQPALLSQGGQIRFMSGKRIERLAVEPYAAYFFFTTPAGQLALHRIGLGSEQNLASANHAGPMVASSGVPAAQQPAAAGVPHTTARPATGKNPKPPAAKPGITTVSVKILVDEEERAAEAAWHKRFADRVKAASDILERHCFIRLEVVEFGTWETDNTNQDFVRALGEFEQEVTPGRARLAIGFSSQYHLPQGRTHLGGTRGPLHSHLLMREWSQHLSEPERLEILLHELGHVFGAVHSPEHDSVMRPVLGDRLSRAARFRIGFDPVNTLAMCLVSEQLAQRPEAKLPDLSPECRIRLAAIYGELAKAQPDDPAADHYLKLIEQTGFGLHLRVRNLQGGTPQNAPGRP